MPFNGTNLMFSFCFCERRGSGGKEGRQEGLKTLNVYLICSLAEACFSDTSTSPTRFLAYDLINEWKRRAHKKSHRQTCQNDIQLTWGLN